MGWQSAVAAGGLGLLVAVVPSAAAQEESSPEAVDEAPLAVPVGQEPPASARPRVEEPLAVPGRRQLSAEEVAAVRTYRREQLSVRGYRETYVGSTTTFTGGYGRWGWGWGGGWGWTTPYVMEVEGWNVWQGSHPLSVPEALEALGEPGRRVELERSIRRKRSTGTALYVLGGAGLVTSIVGLVGLDQARTWPEARAWSTVSTASMLGAAGAFVAGSFPLGKARRLAVDPALTLRRDEAQAKADAMNARLAAELGLSPEQALRLEERSER